MKIATNLLILSFILKFALTDDPTKDKKEVLVTAAKSDISVDDKTKLKSMIVDILNEIKSDRIKEMKNQIIASKNATDTKKAGSYRNNDDYDDDNYDNDSYYRRPLVSPVFPFPYGALSPFSPLGGIGGFGGLGGLGGLGGFGAGLGFPGAFGPFGGGLGFPGAFGAGIPFPGALGSFGDPLLGGSAFGF